MNFSDLINFLGNNLAVILATLIIVTPIVWGIINFLYQNRLEEIEARNKDLQRRLSESSETESFHPPTEGNLQNDNSLSKRISLICSTSYEIESSQEKALALKLFYKSLWENIERTSFGINTCGAEPLRSVLHDYYVEKQRTSSRSYMIQLDKRVRWYWFPGDAIGFNYEPSYFEGCRTIGANDRTAKEMADSDIIVAFAGRTGTRDQVSRLVQCHYDSSSKIDLNRKPLILLAWFGGTVKEYIDENRNNIIWLLDKYPELNPSEQVEDWFIDNKPTLLAEKLVHTIQKLLLRVDV